MKCLLNAWQDHEKIIFFWLRKNLKNHEQAEDLSQELFIKAMKNSELFCGVDDAKSWLFVMAKNTLIDFLRKNKQCIVSFDDLNSEFEAPEIKETQAAVLQLQHCLPKVLPKLNDADRLIIESCDLQGLSQKEFAKVNDMSYSTVKSQLQRARKKLEATLIQECEVRYQENKVCCFKEEKR
ncbi:MAG TPA: sigma-70 family RNA polymerase sigma factor [Psychromonas hadalis]|nr:sigma-70 family RNA polymerase sigma factor [Psychromonas hadalis]